MTKIVTQKTNNKSKSYQHFFVLFLSIILSWSHSAIAVVELNEFSSEEIKGRYNALIEELRCPKCQNQNLAGSDSEVAIDLRREVLLLLEEGYSDQDIRDFMHERYGDFILYNPPVGGKTLLVWVLPVLFFLAGIFAAIYIVRNAIRNSALNQGNNDIEETDQDLDDLDFNTSNSNTVSSNTVSSNTVSSNTVSSNTVSSPSSHSSSDKTESHL